MRIPRIKAKHFLHTGKIVFWFLTGAVLALFFILSFSFLIFKSLYANSVYPGVSVNGVNFGGETQKQVKSYFESKNYAARNVNFIFTSDQGIATASAEEINFGYNSDLLANQAFNLGRSDNFLSNLTIIVEAYVNGIDLPASYTYSQSSLINILFPVISKINIKPVNAQFAFANGKVTTFTPSANGKQVSLETLNNQLLARSLMAMSARKTDLIIIPLPVETVAPDITTDKANSLGIKELIGVGHSLFYDSIASRIYNIKLAATRLNGILVAPGDTFSFDKALGDISAFTGYQQAYIIQNGRTVLGDGGGVCQVSTTFFRALLNAGLPIVERHAHAYRVGYYEEDSPPGFDATIYVPTVDLKFKNDTGHYILIESETDLSNDSLAFYLYGTSDGRQVTISKPVITNQTPPPSPLYQDDPNLPSGVLQQTDFAAWGANVYFTRQVTKNGKPYIFDKFVSDYQPWQAVYLRGTGQ